MAQGPENEARSAEEGRAEGEEAREAIARLLSPFRAFVAYSPLRTEADWRALARLPEGAAVRIVPPRASLDPAEEALAALRFAGDAPCAVLLPGRRFDAAGTRHGQGGGWYDRFLARVPQEWLRIGFCRFDQLSETALPRQAWDQPVDAVVVAGADGSATLLSCTASASSPR